MQDGNVVVNDQFLWEAIARVGDKTMRMSDEEKKSRERKEKAREQREQRQKRHELIRGASGGGGSGPNLESKYEQQPLEAKDQQHCDNKQQVESAAVVADVAMQQQQAAPSQQQAAPSQQQAAPSQQQAPPSQQQVPPSQQQVAQQHLENELDALRSKLQDMCAREEALKMNAEMQMAATTAQFEKTLQDFIQATSTKMESMMSKMETMTFESNFAREQYEELLHQKLAQDREIQMLRDADMLAERHAREAEAAKKLIDEEEKKQQKQQDGANDATTNKNNAAKWHDDFNKSVAYAKLNAMKHGFVCLTAAARTLETLNGAVGHPLALDHFGDRIDLALKEGEFNDSIAGFVEDPFAMSILSTPAFGVGVTFLQTLTKTHTENLKELNRTGVYGYQRGARKFNDAPNNAAQSPTNDKQEHKQQQPESSTKNEFQSREQQSRGSSKCEDDIGGKSSASPPSHVRQHRHETQNNVSAPNPATSWGKRALQKNSEKSSSHKMSAKDPNSDSSSSDDDEDDVDDMDVPTQVYVRDPITGAVRKAAICEFGLQDNDNVINNNLPKMENVNGLVGALDFALNTMSSKAIAKPKTPDFNDFLQ